ncbi:helix-turn-helix transcriptional regulator [Kitasatospora sp. A2-31]|uniref:helix-turn-helix transcriptional regulator n=1 Tax=Kitasatospora sp. A2-31 TaxID=2916414 RepID=UPI001EEACEE0|nr:helix-turn-helix transcriptional regulator [Kitasatospora sp. A2-31]MCG6494104.1 helix-turn-helix transcriptional regulator [Kitasatospora sp. A2-31]
MADSQTLLFDSARLDETEEFLSMAYTPMHIGGPVEDARVRISRRAAGPVTLDRLDFGYTMAYDARDLGRVCLVSMHDGTLADLTSGSEEVFGPGETFLLAPPDRPYRGEVRAARYTIALFDTALLDAVAPTAPGEQPIRLTGSRPVTAAANRQLASAVAYVRDHVLDDPAACENDLVVSTAARHLAAVALAALPHSARDTGRPSDTSDATPDTVRRAVAFIESHADQDITLARIAAAACVTPRALQYAFRRHLGTTPLGHLRRVRLDAAHRDLLAGDPGSTTVTEIAMRWGFAHPGHFAARYREVYRTSPSTALNRRV